QLLEHSGEQRDRFHLVQRAVPFAFAARSAQPVEDHCFGHFGSPQESLISGCRSARLWRASTRLACSGLAFFFVGRKRLRKASFTAAEFLKRLWTSGSITTTQQRCRY